MHKAFVTMVIIRQQNVSFLNIGKNLHLNFYCWIETAVSLGPKISETVKGKLRLGTRILQARGLERVFRKSFNVGEDEKLIKAFQCHLSTSAGPIAGLLYISTEKIAFHSDMSFRFTSSKGNTLKSYYKVSLHPNKHHR